MALIAGGANIVRSECFFRDGVSEIDGLPGNRLGELPTGYDASAGVIGDAVRRELDRRTAA